jgi:hypothetical protein
VIGRPLVRGCERRDFSRRVGAAGPTSPLLMPQGGSQPRSHRFRTSAGTLRAGDRGIETISSTPDQRAQAAAKRARVSPEEIRLLCLDGRLARLPCP